MKLLIDLAKEEDKKRLFRILKGLKPVRHVIELKQFRKQRSQPQNKYYWSVIIGTLSKELGYFPDEIHDILKRKFLPKEVVIRSTGEMFVIGSSTTELDTAAAEEFYERIREWALSELTIYLPLPGEVIEL